MDELLDLTPLYDEITRLRAALAEAERERDELRKNFEDYLLDYKAFQEIGAMNDLRARAKRAELAAHPDYVEQVLRDGARRARAVAEQTMTRARKACG